MTERTIRLREQAADDLESWERWPLAALFLANALNVFLLYVPADEMPNLVRGLLPWVRVFCGIAAAVSLEGTLIAVTMGRRHGRDSYWSWATMFAAAAFTAAVAYYVHHDVGLAAAGLFMAQAVVLFIYSQHLAQPRKALQSADTVELTAPKPLGAPVLAKARAQSVDRVSVSVRDNFSCKVCGDRFQTLVDVSRHARKAHPKKSASVLSSIPTEQSGDSQISRSEV